MNTVAQPMTLEERRARRAVRWRRALPDLIAQLLLLALLAVIVFPFYWTINSTLRPSSQLFTLQPQWIPAQPTLENYAAVLANAQFLRAMANSFIAATGTALLATAVCCLAGYSLARYRYPGRKTIMAGLVVSQMLPGVLIVLPLFVVFARLGLVNTYLGLILGYSTFAIPFAALMLRAFFANFPVELEEAATVDGCTRLGAFGRITLPLSAPAIVAVGLFAFVLAWNDLLFSLVLTRDISTMTVAVQLYNIATTQFATNWGAIIAEGSLIVVPVALLFVFLQSHLVEGMSAGALKF